MINGMTQLLKDSQLIILIASTIIGTVMALAINTLRVKLADRPVKAKTIIIPPFMMSTGLFMFLVPLFRITWLQVGEAVIVGMFFSLFLIHTTTFKVLEGKVYMIPSRAFVFILFGLLFFRI